MRVFKFFIEGKLPGENEINALNRIYRVAGNQRVYAYAERKDEVEKKISAYAMSSEDYPLDEPLRCFEAHFHWVEPNNRRDPDNIAAGVKFIFDALRDLGVIEGDGRKNVKSISHSFETDKDFPHIVVNLIENLKI